MQFSSGTSSAAAVGGPKCLRHSPTPDLYGKESVRVAGHEAPFIVEPGAGPLAVVSSPPVPYRSLGGQAMLTDISPSTKAVGFWSAVLATIFSLLYVFGQLPEWMGWLGSRGGPESSSTALGLVVLLTPSLLLGSAFLVLVVSIHQVASPDRRIWSHAAVAFATAYAVLISMVYYVQLTLIAPRLASGQVAGIEPFLYVPFNSFFYSVDLLGYSFMSLATLFAARVFTGGGWSRIIRRFLTANGLLLPFLALQIYFHPLIWIAALWAVTFPGSTWSLAIFFKRAGTPGIQGANVKARR